MWDDGGEGFLESGGFVMAVFGFWKRVACRENGETGRIGRGL